MVQEGLKQINYFSLGSMSHILTERSKGFHNIYENIYLNRGGLQHVRLWA